jgi:hypothetical protein
MPMPESWVKALRAYCYHVDLSKYRSAHEYPGAFSTSVAGDRDSTIAFEDRFRQAATDDVKAYLEVVYWKLYSQAAWRDRCTSRIAGFIEQHGVTAAQLWQAVQEFVGHQTRANLRAIRRLLGIKTRVLALALTLPALAAPARLPMVDKQVARWVNKNRAGHNANRDNELSPFRMNYTSLRDNDFESYLDWVAWCREVAQLLTKLTPVEWRARDVEMAVFTAQRSTRKCNTGRHKRLELNVLP